MNDFYDYLDEWSANLNNMLNDDSILLSAIEGTEADNDKKDDTLYFALALRQGLLKQYQEALTNIDIAISINPREDFYSVKSKIEEKSVSKLNKTAYRLDDPKEDAIFIKDFCQKHLLNIFKIDINLI